jgi:hypothetical protein
MREGTRELWTAFYAPIGLQGSLAPLVSTQNAQVGDFCTLCQLYNVLRDVLGSPRNLLGRGLFRGAGRSGLSQVRCAPLRAVVKLLGAVTSCSSQQLLRRQVRLVRLDLLDPGNGEVRRAYWFGQRVGLRPAGTHALREPVQCREFDAAKGHFPLIDLPVQKLDFSVTLFRIYIDVPAT